MNQRTRDAVDEALRGLSHAHRVAEILREARAAGIELDSEGSLRIGHYLVNYGYSSEDPIVVETWGPSETTPDV